MSGRAVRALVVAVIASLALGAPIASAGPAASTAAPISNVVTAALASKGEATAWVQLKATADLSAAFRIADWNARGRYVYDQLTSVARRSQAGLLQSLAARSVPAQSFWIINAVRVTGTAATFKSIAARSDVERIFESTTVELSPVTPGAVEGAVQSVEWGIDNINANDVWATYGNRGEGIVVGTIDTGVLYTHPAVVNQYRGNTGGGSFNHNYNWWDPSHICATAAPCDNNGHGTHTMGTIVGDDGAGNQVGVAPGARWIAAKGCESSSCSDTALLSSGQFMLAPTDLTGASPNAALRPNLVSNSWGGGPAQPWYQSTVDAWVASGIFPVFANGNAGPACGTAGSPGDYLNSYGVGAYDITNTIASFSSRGVLGGSEIKPNISAPGVNVRSSWNDGGYASISGTSMATPHVAGVVALMFGAAPSLIGQITQTRQILDQTAIDTSDLTCGGAAADNNVWGEGRIDAFAAVTASPRGPVGTLTGTVTSAGNPLAGATIAISGPSSRTTTTNGSGVYTVVLPVGTTYSVTASRFGYLSSTANNVAISQGNTTTQNFVLSVAPAHTVSGTVRDNGSPQATVSGAVVSIPGTPIAPVTTNASGAYSFPAVPEGSYTALANPPSRCLTSQSLALTVGAGDVAGFDFTLPARQDAFGYRCRLEVTPFVAATDPLTLNGDDVVATVALPFAFSFYGSPYSSANVSTNGLVSFTDTNNSWSNAAIPSAVQPNTAIYAYWDDLLVDNPTSGVFTSSVGSAPNRRFVIEWRNIRYYGDATRRVSFEVILNENGDVQTLYNDISAGDGMEMGNSATTGIENQAGSVALQYSNGEAALSTGLAVRYFIPSGGGNTPPVANGDSATTNEDSAVTIDVLGNDTDADGNPLSIAAGSVSDPPHGTASIVGGQIQYTPDLNYFGSDSFTYRAFDGTAQSAPATVSLTVNSVNDLPTVSVILVSGTTSCSAAGGTIALSVSDAETAAGSLGVSASTSSSKTGALLVGGAGAVRSLTAPGTGAKVTATITVTVSDGTGSTQLAISFRAGGSGKDTLTGGGGPDILIGNGGNDTLRGNAGVDLLCGGGGVDSLTGGTQADWFDGGTSIDVYTDRAAEDLGPAA